jgi:hypothetical protein
MHVLGIMAALEKCLEYGADFMTYSGTSVHELK